MNNLSITLGVNADYVGGWACARFKNSSGGSEIFELKLRPKSSESWSLVAGCIEDLAALLRDVTLRPLDHMSSRDEISDYVLQQRLPLMMTGSYEELEWSLGEVYSQRSSDWF